MAGLSSSWFFGGPDLADFFSRAFSAADSGSLHKVIALVQHATDQPGNSATAHPSGTLGATPTEGNLLVIAQYFATTLANMNGDPTNFLVAAQDENDNAVFCVRCIYKIAGAGESTSFTTNTVGAVADRQILMEFSGVDPHSPLRLSNGNDPIGTNNTTTPGSITPAIVGELLLAFTGQANNNGGSETISSPYTLVDAGTTRLTCGYAVTADVTAKNPTITWLTGVGIDSLHVAFEPQLVPAVQPAVVSGTGTVQTTLEVEQALPGVVAGTGSVQASVAVAIPTPALVAGTGAVQSTFFIIGDQQVVPGTGTVQTARIVEAALPPLLAGTGTVQASVAVAIPTSAVVPGTGTTQTAIATSIATPAVVAGTGRVPNYSLGYLTYATNSDLATAPDTAALSFSGDLDLRVRLADTVPSLWQNSNLNILGKWGGLQCSWFLDLLNGKPQFGLSSDGTASAGTIVQSTAQVSLATGSDHWLRVTYRISDRRVQFFTADGALAQPASSDWAQVGANVTHTTASIFDSTSPVELGLASSGDRIGKFYGAEVRNGIDGTVVASPDWTLATASTSTITDAQGNVWTKASGATQTVAIVPPRILATARPTVVAGVGSIGQITEVETQDVIVGIGRPRTVPLLIVALPDVIAGSGSVETPVEIATALPDVVAASGTVETVTISTNDDATPTPAVVSGTGTVQDPLELLAGAPDVVAGSGVTQTTIAVATALPSLIAGVGTTEATLIVEIASPDVVSGSGTVQTAAPTGIDLAIVITGAGSVAAPVIVEAAVPGLLAGAGAVQDPLELVVGLLTVINGVGSPEAATLVATVVPDVVGGVGSVNSALVTLNAQPVVLSGAGSVQDAALVLAALAGQIVGAGTISAPTIVEAALASTIGATGTTQAASTIESSSAAVVAGVGSLDAPVGVVVALPSCVDATGTVEAPAITTDSTTTVSPVVVEATGTVAAPLGVVDSIAHLVVGSGTTSAPTGIVVIFPDAVDASGAVQAVGFIEGAATVNALGTTEAALIELVQFAQEISGVGTVPQSAIVLRATPDLVAGTGTVELSSSFIVLGEGSTFSVLVDTQATPSTLSGIGSALAATLATVPFAISASGTTLSPITSLSALPVTITGLGTIFLPHATVEAVYYITFAILARGRHMTVTSLGRSTGVTAESVSESVTDHGRQSGIDAGGIQIPL